MEGKKGLAQGALQRDDFLRPKESEEESGLQVFSGLEKSANVIGASIRLKSVERRTLSSLIEMTEAPTGKHEDNLALKFSRRTLPCGVHGTQSNEHEAVRRA